MELSALAPGLARDVERYLKDEPVEACPPSASYRLRKVVRKHRRLLTTATAFALLLLVGTAVSLGFAVWALRASREIYAPHGMVSPSGVETLVKSLESFGVLKDGQKPDIASTYDMKFVRQAIKDLKLP